jgi:hypothetical protein
MFKSFQDMGIPSGYGFKQLLYSPAVNILVVQTCSSGHDWRPEHLYFRHADSAEYRKIGAPDDFTSQESPFTHPSEPLLAYNSMQHRFTVDAQGKQRHSGDWDSLNVFNLESGVEVASIKQASLRLPTGVARGWIADIVAFVDAGLFVKAGLSVNGTRIDYFIAKVNFAQRTLTTVASLPTTFM